MRQSKYTRELLEPLVARSISLAQLLRTLGLRPTGGNYRMIAGRLRLLEIPTGHFRGQGWAGAESRDSHPSIARWAERLARSDDEVFVANSPETNGSRLARRLVRLGWSYRCAECETVEWRGGSLRLHLDHFNGIHNDNRLENLRFLCPNCHSQTGSYCRRGWRTGPAQ